MNEVPYDNALNYQRYILHSQVRYHGNPASSECKNTTSYYYQSRENKTF